MTEYIHGRTDAREVARLEKQARFCASFILPQFDAPPGARVLDLATGVGATAGVLLERYPGIRLTGVDLSPSQLAHARANHPGPFYVQADAARLPFRDASFDRVHCTWLLEHVRNPVAVLEEVRRVLRPGGYCLFSEVDNGTFRTVPELAEVSEVMAALNQAQRDGGGDPFVGRRLASLFEQAGFARVVVRPSRLVGTADDPAFYRAFVEEFAEIFESLDESLAPEMRPRLAAAAEKLRALPGLPGSRMEYCGAIAQGFR